MNSESVAVATIGKLIEVVPEEESKLLEQLVITQKVSQVVGIDDAGKRDGFEAARWHRAVQLLGNRVLELKQGGGVLPEWVEQATAITRGYGMPNAAVGGGNEEQQ